MSRIQKLKDRQAELVEQNQIMLASVEQEDRDMNDEEKQSFDAATTEFEGLNDELSRLEKAESQLQIVTASADPPKANRGRGPVEPDFDEPQDTGSVIINRAGARQSGPSHSVPAQPRRNAGTYGFANLGDFAMSVRHASISGGSVDPRLAYGMRAAATTYGNESVGEQGGFAVPPDFREAIMKKVFGEDSLLSLTDPMQSSSNNLTFPKDETTPWGTSGIQASWDSEGAAATQTRPDLGQETCRLNKLRCFVPVTEELLEDAPAMDSFLRMKAPEVMTAKINTALVRGTGSGQPKGILNADCLVTVAKESGQTADTVVHANLANMYARMYAPSRRTAVWLINQDVEPQLFTLNAAGATPSTPIFMPPGGISAAPYGTIFGRPIVPIEPCSALGDAGDVIFADFRQYLAVTKSGQSGIRVDTSIHLYFDQDATAYRFIFRLGGQPWWSGAIARENGSNTLSCFVTLAERA